MLLFEKVHPALVRSQKLGDESLLSPEMQERSQSGVRAVFETLRDPYTAGVEAKQRSFAALRKQK